MASSLLTRECPQQCVHDAKSINAIANCLARRASLIQEAQCPESRCTDHSESCSTVDRYDAEFYCAVRRSCYRRRIVGTSRTTRRGCFGRCDRGCRAVGHSICSCGNLEDRTATVFIKLRRASARSIKCQSRALHSHPLARNWGSGRAGQRTSGPAALGS